MSLPAGAGTAPVCLIPSLSRQSDTQDKHMKLKTILAATAATLAFAIPSLADIMVHHGYARSSGMMAKSGAAFMVIENTGEADHLVSVTSDAAKRVELHTHIENEEGVMQMVHVEEGFEIPAGG